MVIQCMVLKGDLPLEIRWMHNNVPIELKTGVNVMLASPRVSSLNIESVLGEHRGKYTCVASNKAGVMEYSAELNVNGTIFFVQGIY